MFSDVKEKIAAVEQKVVSRVQISSTYGPVAAFFNVFQGRSTFFAIFFATEGVILIGVGIWGFIKGHDLSSYASFVGSMAVFNGLIQGIMVAHSCKEDWAALKQQQHDLNVTIQTQSPASSTTAAS